jgi:hypothetical protein
LHGLWVKPDLLDRAFKPISRESIDGKVDTLRLLDQSDIGLVYVSHDLHLRQVVGNGKESRGRETCGDGLTDIHVTRNDHAVNRRSDRRV